MENREREKGAGGLWGAWPLCYFLELLALAVAEKTLRTKFREVLSPAAVAGVLRGDALAPSDHRQGELLGLGVGKKRLLFWCSYGETEAGLRKTFYIRSWDELAVQPSAPSLFSVEVKRDVNVQALCGRQDNDFFTGGYTGLFKPLLTLN